MNENPADSLPCTNTPVLVQIARTLGASRGGQCLAAIGVGAAFAGLAWLAWHNRDLAAMLVAFFLLGHGLEKAAGLWPISAQTRARWARYRQSAESCWAFPLRILLWFGICGLAVEAGNQFLGRGTSPVTVSFPAVFLFLGALAYFICHRHVRRARAQVISANGIPQA